MVRQFVLGCLFVVAAVTQAAANGRPPGTSTIHFKQGNDQEIFAGMTFGAAVSHDGGATWYWMCEKAIGYSGMYDPKYAYSQTGSVFATTFDGLKVMRDGCTFEPTVQGAKFISQVTLGSDHALYCTAVDPATTMPPYPGDVNIYKSTNDGVTFPTSANPGMINDWWQSLEVAPGDPQRIYASGYRMSGSSTLITLFKSINGGTNFTPMSLTGLTIGMQSSTVEIVGVSSTIPDEVYARVTFETSTGDGLYRSTNGGGSWTAILHKPGAIQFLIRSNGDLVVGTQAEGSFVSHDKGANWVPLTNPPHINCLVENAAHEVWACTQNYGGMQILSDGFGIMKSTDLVTWTPVFKFQDIKAPVTCPAGTIQADQCAPMATWCPLKYQLGITSDYGNCPPLFDATVSADAGTGSGSNKGCCDAGDASSGPTALAIGSAVGVVLIRRRRRARSC